MTPTQGKVLRALGEGPATYYQLMAKVEVRESTLNKAVLGLLDEGLVKEVWLGEIIGLKKKETEQIREGREFASE